MTDFAAIFRSFGTKYSTRENRGWVNVACPWCGDRTFNGGFNVRQGYYHCWKCGGHRVVDTLSMVLRVGKGDSAALLRRYKGEVSDANETRGRIAGAEKLVLPTDGFTPGERKYLKGRGFLPSFLRRKYGVTGGGIAGRWKYRVIVPLYLDGRLVSWVARSILPKKTLEEHGIPRYKNLSIEESVVNPKEVFFNVDHCTRNGVMVEGTFDVMRLGDGFFCSLGTELTEAQVRFAARRFDRVTVVFDNEEAAQGKASKFAARLAAVGVETSVCNAYSYYGVNDGGELNEEQARELSGYFFS